MNNKTGFNRLGLKTDHRKALKRNMVISLFKYEQITTTKAKAKEVRRLAEKLITRAKVDTVHNRRQAARFIHDKEMLSKLFAELSKRYEKRAGGYTRMVKLGYRQGDAAQLVILELVDKVKRSASDTVEEAKPAKEKKVKKSSAETTTNTTKAPEAAPVAKSVTAKKTTTAKKTQRGSSARGK